MFSILFATDSSQNYSSITDTCLTSSVPQSTALGHLAYDYALLMTSKTISSNILKIYADDIYCKDNRWVCQTTGCYPTMGRGGKCKLGYLIDITSLIIIITFIMSSSRNQHYKIQYKIRYLGVHIDNKLTWKSHIDTIVNKANRVEGLS